MPPHCSTSRRILIRLWRIDGFYCINTAFYSVASSLLLFQPKRTSRALSIAIKHLKSPKLLDTRFQRSCSSSDTERPNLPLEWEFDMGKKAKSVFYAVRKGFKPGVYLTWCVCSRHVRTRMILQRLSLGPNVNLTLRAFQEPSTRNSRHGMKRRRTQVYQDYPHPARYQQSL